MTTKVVEFEGRTNAKIYIVGEAPGTNEELEGRPFVGGAGRLLDRLLMESGLVRRECRIGNVMRVRPPNNDFCYFYVDRGKKVPSDALVEGIRYLKEDIKKTNPNVVVALGNEALRALTGESGINNWRGSILFCSEVGCKVIPTIHPASLLRAWNNLPLVMFDFKRVREEAKTSDFNIRKREFKIRPTYGEVINEIKRLMTVDKLSFDVETDEDRHITAIALTDSPWTGMSIPFTNSTGAPYWRVEEEVEIWKMLKLLLEYENVKKIAQNAQFDIVILRVNPWRIHVRGLVFDTMCGHHTVYPELAASESTLTGKHRIGGGKSLGLLCSIYTRQPYYKHWGKSGNDETFWKYNCMDAAVTLECAEVIEKEMKEFGVYEFYYKLVHPLIDILIEMQMRGVKIDQEVRVKAWEDISKETNALQTKLGNVIGREINVMSPKQLKELLYHELNLPPVYKKGTTQLTTNEEALETLSKKTPSPIFDLILKIRGNRKMLGTYLSDKGGEDGRMRCSYVIGGTETGRLSSRESVFGTGTNLQNIPPGVCRRMFIPDEGKVFLNVDLSQAETRVVAYLAEEERLIEFFDKGGDIHRLNASWIYGVNVGDVTSEQREKAKRGVHALDYGMGPVLFGKLFGCSKTEAVRLSQKYFDTFPKIKAWQFRTQAQLGKCRTLTTPLGRKRTFFGMWGDQLFREAYAFVPQSTVGDTLNLAMIRLHQAHPDVEFMLQNHDAFVIQVDDDKVGMWRERVKEAFDIKLYINGKTLVLPFDMKVGKNWQDMTKI